ncbi:sensor histidine kinase [Nubsella zeaxanthinifaciens]|uniref:sensor histidine kinase n=1 Tax=Nubsella zeaxanthinifaciens TaxID=392412 RepID=UPI003D001943
MKKILLTFLGFILCYGAAYAQNGINFSKAYAAGGKLMMYLDSAAKNVSYANVFPNQPRTSFNSLLDVNAASIHIYFRDQSEAQNYRYTILQDDKPILLNKSLAGLEKVDLAGEMLISTKLGNFPIKGHVVTILGYSINQPQNVDQTVFYGKLLPRAVVKAFSKRYAVAKGVDYAWIKNPKSSTKLTFDEKDDQLTIVKDKSAIDYIYSLSIVEKRTNKLVFKSTAWQYGGLVENNEFLPFLEIDKAVFKNSGDYEVIIEPLVKWTETDLNSQFTAKYTLSITLANKSYTKMEVVTYIFIAAFSIAIVSIFIFLLIKKRNKKIISEESHQKNVAKLQLGAIRSQLNPHFMFNALAGIQNLMNKNEIENANKYLSKFARLTRNVLDGSELVSLAKEKTLLDDYLQMEQLRFGFSYEITADKNLDLENIEIPSMLLQPFVENAVKHGVASKQSNGKIRVSFNKQNQHLILTVKDNGNGFLVANEHKGLGLSLSKNSISLLNSIYKDTSFLLDVASDNSGTMITLTLKDWL